MKRTLLVLSLLSGAGFACSAGSTPPAKTALTIVPSDLTPDGLASARVVANGFAVPVKVLWSGDQFTSRPNVTLSINPAPSDSAAQSVVLGTDSTAFATLIAAHSGDATITAQLGAFVVTKQVKIVDPEVAVTFPDTTSNVVPIQAGSDGYRIRVHAELMNGAVIEQHAANAVFTVLGSSAPGVTVPVVGESAADAVVVSPVAGEVGVHVDFAGVENTGVVTVPMPSLSIAWSADGWVDDTPRYKVCITSNVDTGKVQLQLDGAAVAPSDGTALARGACDDGAEAEPGEGDNADAGDVAGGDGGTADVPTSAAFEVTTTESSFVLTATLPGTPFSSAQTVNRVDRHDAPVFLDCEPTTTESPLLPGQAVTFTVKATADSASGAALADESIQLRSNAPAGTLPSSIVTDGRGVATVTFLSPDGMRELFIDGELHGFHCLQPVDLRLQPSN